MDLKPPTINNLSSEFDSSSSNNLSEKISSDDDDPYSFSSTSTSLIGLAIVFIMLGIPLLAVINDRPAAEKNLPLTSLEQNGPESSTSFTISWFS